MKYFIAALFTLICIFWLLSTLWVVLAGAEHRPELDWMAEKTGARGVECCGISDCTEIPVLFLETTDEGTTVIIGDVEITLPSQWVHPSENGKGYWCFVPSWPVRNYEDANGNAHMVPPENITRENTRCVFYTSTG